MDGQGHSVAGEAEQLVLALAHRPAHGAEDFIVSGCNQAAVASVDGWPDWPNAPLLIMGDAGAGKTHLANVWRSKSGAALYLAQELDDAAVREIAGRGAGVVENIERGVAAEQALFHLINLAREGSIDLLLTSRVPPGALAFRIPDLGSRFHALPVVEIAAPDDDLLRAVLVKLLNDRQLPATPAAIGYLVRYMDRSMASAIAIVEAIDRALWRRPGIVTRAVASRVLQTCRILQN